MLIKLNKKYCFEMNATFVQPMIEQNYLRIALLCWMLSDQQVGLMWILQKKTERRVTWQGIERKGTLYRGRNSVLMQKKSRVIQKSRVEKKEREEGRQGREGREEGRQGGRKVGKEGIKGRCIDKKSFRAKICGLQILQMTSLRSKVELRHNKIKRNN